jgi:tetratricopeptide (TPR) repeat protein
MVLIALSYCPATPVMRRVAFSISLLLGAACSPSLPAQIPSAQSEDAPASGISGDLSKIPVAPAQRLELEDALSRHDFKRAETILVEESNRNPKSPEAAKLLEIAGSLFFQDRQYLDAAIAWKRSEAILPLDPRSRFTLAMTCIKLGRSDWARVELEKLVATEPKSVLYLYWLARLDYDAQSYSAAVERLRKVIEMDPSMMRAYDLLGLCHDYLGQFDEAIRSYARAVELNRLQPKPSPWPLVDMSISLVAVNRLPEAEKSLREALSYDVRLAQAHYQLGRVLEMQRQDQAAIQSLNQAVALDSSYPDPHYLLGRVYQRLGEEQLAKTEIEQFKRLSKTRDTPALPGSRPPTE